MAGPFRQLVLPAIGAAVLTCPLVLRLAGVDLTLPANTHPLAVGLGAAVFAGIAIAVAAAAGLPGRINGLIARHQRPEQVIAELSELAGLVRQHGLLHAIVDSRAKGRELFVAGLQLLLRDADEQLLRATLEAETERIERTRDQSLSNAASACRIGAAAMLAAVIAAGAIMLRVAAAPAAISTATASGLLAAAVLGVAGLVTSVPGARLLQQAAARRAFARLAERHAVEAVRLGEATELAERRLRALLPEAERAAEGVGIRRAA